MRSVLCFYRSKSECAELFKYFWKLCCYISAIEYGVRNKKYIVITFSKMQNKMNLKQRWNGKSIMLIKNNTKE